MPSLSYLSPKVAPRESPIHGTGLFAVEPLAAGEVVCVKGGYVFDRETLRAMPGWFRAAEIQVADDLFIGPLGEEERAGSMIYSNHSCEPNIGVRGQVVFVALRDIAAGEELTYDYAYERDGTEDEAWERLYVCKCGAPTCRGTILAPPKKRGKK